MNIEQLDALILCGGLGTRLRPVVTDRPKCLVEIAGRPILDIQIERLARQGLRRIIFCVGHMREQIVARYADRRDLDLVFSVEAEPLGTGGALRNALPYVSSDPFLVLNGDSLCDVDLARLLAFHQSRKAVATLVLARPNERNDGGIVEIDEALKIICFVEKPAANAASGGYFSAGIYLLEKDVLATPAGPSFSIERDIFPDLSSQNRCYGYPVSGGVYDIGTPERYDFVNRTIVAHTVTETPAIPAERFMRAKN